MKTRPEVIRLKRARLRAVHISSNIMSSTNISNLLLQNINKPLPAETQLDKVLPWGKSLSTLPIFRRREIDLNVRKCVKLKGRSISKASARGRLFKHERFLSSDLVYTEFRRCIFMSKLDAKQVWRKNYEMFEFNYVRGQVRCTKQHVHALQGKVAIVTT